MDHSNEFLKLVNDVLPGVREVSVDKTRERMKNGATLIDVREDNEFEAAHAAGAKHMGCGVIERDIVQTVPDKDAELILYCGGGYRSASQLIICKKWATETSGRWPAVGTRGKNPAPPSSSLCPYRNDSNLEVLTSSAPRYCLDSHPARDL